jgi:drug/metabolite transporter (DMT)-like permease
MTSVAQSPQRWKVILAFGLVYVFWGSTYLGIRIGVEHIPPLLMAGTRFLIAGPLMLLFCAMRGKKVAVNWGQALRLAGLGILMLSGANTILSWAEQWVPTGLASLIVSVTPLWFLVLETWIFTSEHRPSPRALVGLGLGVAGIFVLLWPQLRNTGSIGHAELFGSIGLIFGSLSWALGSLLSKRWKIDLDAFSAASWEMTFAGAANVLFALSLGEHHSAIWTTRGVGAIFYLVVFGSWVGFTAYIYLLNHVPTPKVATYAYVNPVVAVFLGWIVLHERITPYILVGTVIVVGAVALVTGAELKKRAPEALPVLPAVEGAGD